jgi:hypothetical protein
MTTRVNAWIEDYRLGSCRFDWSMIGFEIYLALAGNKFINIVIEGYIWSDLLVEWQY